MSLEVDHRDDLPIPQQVQMEAFRYPTEKENQAYTYSAVEEAPSKPVLAQYQPSQRWPMILLSVALAAMTALAIIAAAVGGSIAVKRSHEISNLKSSLDSANNEIHQYAARLNANSSSPASSASNCTPETPKNSTSTLNNSTIVPITNCTALEGSYVTAQYGSLFSTHCELDFPGSDMLGVWANNFADCMEACASWNYHAISPQCAAVSFDISNTGDFVENSGLGNCFFKSSETVIGHSKNVTSSAVAQKSS